MKTTILRILGAASCLTLASCATWPYENSHEAAQRDGSGYSLDNPATGSRYMAGADTTAAGTPTDSGAVAGPSVPTEAPSVSTPVPTTGPTPGPSVTPPPVVAPPSTAAPSYGTPVPGRRGFVYPPGVDAKPENMVDVRDFQPGQKVRDPRTGKIFLVP
jgi:hypothetical protein